MKALRTWGAAALLILAALLTVTPLSAADKGGPIEQLPVVDTSSKAFNGGYIGAMIAYPTETTSLAGGLINFDSTDLRYGAKVGYDIRWAGTNFVTGISASYMRGGVGNAVAGSDRSWDILARGGFIVGGTTLLYGTAGYYNDDATFFIPAFKMPDKGITYGLGIESYMTKNITVEAQVLSVDQGTSGVGLGGIESRIWVPRVGLNYRF